MSESEIEERGRLIEEMLDKIYPINPRMPEDVQTGVHDERQMLVMRARWNDMPLAQLRRVAAGHQ